jgi:surfactin synthase thioesterase subunit
MTAAAPLTVGAWWWPAGNRTGERPVLFFPPAGADQTAARPLLPQLAGLRLGVLRMPGRGSRATEPAPVSLADLTGQLARAIATLDGPPPVLVGHSFGGLLGYAVARALHDAGHPVARLVAVASAPPDRWRARAEAAGPDFADRQTERILGRGDVPAQVAADPALAARARAQIRTDLVLSLQPVAAGPLSCPITVVRGADDTIAEDPAGWSAATDAYVDLVTVPGGHFFYRDDPRRLAERLRMELMALDAAYDLF